MGWDWETGKAVSRGNDGSTIECLTCQSGRYGGKRRGEGWARKTPSVYPTDATFFETRDAAEPTRRGEGLRGNEGEGWIL